jgi:hypothetical protein
VARVGAHLSYYFFYLAFSGNQLGLVLCLLQLSFKDLLKAARLSVLNWLVQEHTTLNRQAAKFNSVLYQPATALKTETC